MSFFRARQKDSSPSASSSSLSASSAASSPRNQPCTLHTPTEALLIPPPSNTDGMQDTGNSEPKPAPGQHVPGPEAGATPPLGTSTSAAALVDGKGRCLACRQEKLSARRYRCKVIVGLIFPFALQALDVTIIASAFPWIATDFGMYM